MGACEFVTTSKGRTIQEAYRKAVDEAHYSHGHRGYTGTIAEKDGALEAAGPPTGETVQDYLQRLWDGDARTELERRDERILMDKWGPALAFDLGGGRWLFTGLASE